MSNEFPKDDYFKIDPEPHLIGDMEHINHFPGVQMWWRAIASISRPLILGSSPESMQYLEPGEMERLKKKYKKGHKYHSKKI